MLKKIFPFLSWFNGYRSVSLRSDLVAGLTVALVLIPQSMAYAQLAGLPPYYGLYASFIPPLIASLFGSSRQLATGPVAVVSLLTAASLEPLATAGSSGYIAYAILLSLLVGIFQFALGILRLGLLVNFISHPVVNGFTNAAAIIIATSQLAKIFGVHVDKADRHFMTIWRVVQAAVHYTHWPTVLLGALAFGIMYGLKRISMRIPNVLAAVVVTTLISWSVGFEHNAVVRLADIKSPRVHELVMKFNQSVDAISSLASTRTENIKLQTAARQSGDAIGVLNTRHAAELAALQMDRVQEDLYTYRERLRRFLFKRVGPTQGPSVYYPLKDIPAESGRVEDRVWRLHIGNKPLEIEHLQMIGGGEVVGRIPGGLPEWSVPRLDFNIVVHLLPFAAIIALLGFMEAISIAKAMAAKTGQRLDPNRELIGQGLANMCGAFARSYPTSGSFSRSAVNLQSGALTGLASVFTSLIVVIVLLFFTPLLYHLPQSVLAAVIMMAVIGLLNVTGFIHAWRAQWYDGAISIIAFICTLAFAPHLDKGILIGVVLSLVVFLYKSMRPTVASLSLYADEALHNSVVYGLQECKYMAVVRFDGPLFFANASYLEDQIAQRRRAKKDLRHILICSNGINDIDASGQESLSLTIDRVRSAGIDISFSGLKAPVMGVLKRSHLIVKIGEDHIYPTIEKALAAIHEQTHRGGEEEDCPLTSVIRLE